MSKTLWLYSIGYSQRLYGGIALGKVKDFMAKALWLYSIGCSQRPYGCMALGIIEDFMWSLWSSFPSSPNSVPTSTSPETSRH